MKLASRAADGPDGRLLVVSRDLSRAVEAKAAATMLQALETWSNVEPGLRAQYDALNAGAEPNAAALDPATLAAALPRSHQFLDASAFLAHNHILADAWGYTRRTEADPPLIYQGLSDRFYPAHGEVLFRSEADDIDFEAEFGVILDATPLGVSPSEALRHVRLVVMINDWSLRAFGPAEMKGGFGFLQAKPPSSVSAIAVTPDELGAWRDGRIGLTLRVHRGAALFGAPDGAAMSYGFGDLIAHAAATRDLCPGTLIGSGTVSNFDAEKVGSGCIAERKALDQLAPPTAATSYLRFGETVRMETFDAAGQSVFGAIEQRVARRPASAWRR
ncbi:fumarylacetoacetate hydrolase family protein [Phenylobacterium sp.]|jgi:fumarylacetoacetate (FAA) hydrolase|uniref:fumarylacetoacetate hydrolase family protein n=1 Tax=Phenylobacterium sp. TaxID=1871053 RepID=UPI002E337508|nr:fumarylacetoacetate hydrolase family protein [Phenylobacterium sp.]HEX3364184.1 fumarylacetoacetate hydrolase family protein [Phenylobacterium sp.]